MGITTGKGVMVSSLCLIVVLALVANVNAQCSLSQLSQCISAVTQGTNPPPLCCNEVASADFGCFCNLVSRGNYPPAYVSNAVLVPQKCGGEAYSKLKGKTCAGKSYHTGS